MSTTTDKPVVLRPPVKADRPDPTLATHPPIAPPKPPYLDCQIEIMPNGEGVANVVIPAEVMTRLKRKAQGVALGEYVFKNVIRPALYAETFG